MKKLIIITLLYFGFINYVFAGGDDRDQVLPLSTLNTETQEDFTPLPESNKSLQNSTTSTADLKQLLKEIKKNLNEATDDDVISKSNEYLKSFKENYIDSYSGRFKLLGIFALFLFFTLIYSTFFSKK